ncbi:conserved hypothetical protein [delta proteobacterium NaphS2]|nr:conserved hypothetical protein [delta proteobacterium NaphS2]
MCKIYEPITDEQIKKIHATVREKQIPYEKLYAMIEDLILIPSISSLSRQEACFIIEKLLGDETFQRPPRCRSEDEIPGKGTDFPTMKQIWGIRKMVKELGWDRGHFKAWREKYRHLTIREHNRKQASDLFLVLKKILSHNEEDNTTTDEGNGHVIH